MIRKVILAEDDPDDRDLFITFFSKRKDLQILPVAGNGAELIAYLGTLTSDTQLPDLIVLDQNMPVMNGKQTLKILREHDRYARIPAVIYSTYADSSLIIDCKNLGAKMVAMKPIDNTGYQKMMDDFLEVIE
jgi:CheY-like chemotaxis protein